MSSSSSLQESENPTTTSPPAPQKPIDASPDSISNVELIDLSTASSSFCTTNLNNDASGSRPSTPSSRRRSFSRLVPSKKSPPLQNQEEGFVFCKTPEKSHQLDENSGRRRSTGVVMTFPAFTSPSQSRRSHQKATQGDNTKQSTKKRKQPETDTSARGPPKGRRRRKTCFVWNKKSSTDSPSTPQSANSGQKTPDLMSISASPGGSLLKFPETPRNIESYGMYFADQDVQFKITPFQNRKRVDGLLFEDVDTPPSRISTDTVVTTASTTAENTDPTHNNASSTSIEESFDAELQALYEEQVNQCPLTQRRRRNYEPPANGLSNDNNGAGGFNLTKFLQEKKKKRDRINAQLKARKHGTAGTSRFPKREARHAALGISNAQRKKKSVLLSGRRKKKASGKRSTAPVQQTPKATPQRNNRFVTMRRGPRAASAPSSLDDSLLGGNTTLRTPSKSPRRTTSDRPVATLSRLSRLATPKRRTKSAAQQDEQPLKKHPACLRTPSRKKKKLAGKTYAHTPSKVFDHLKRKSKSAAGLSPQGSPSNRRNSNSSDSQKRPSLLKAPSTKIPVAFRAVSSEVKVSARYEQRRQERLRRRYMD